MNNLGKNGRPGSIVNQSTTPINPIIAQKRTKGTKGRGGPKPCAGKVVDAAAEGRRVEVCG